MGYVVCVLPISEEQPRGPLQQSRQGDGYSNAMVLPHGAAGFGTSNAGHK